MRGWGERERIGMRSWGRGVGDVGEGGLGRMRRDRG